jgi:hypothetical protein
MQPNFKAMTNEELRAYALAHRSELEPLRILYERRTSDAEATWFHPPNSKEEEQQQFERFRRIVSEREGRASEE